MGGTIKDIGTNALRTQDVRRTENVGTFTPQPTHLRDTHIEADKNLSSLENDLKKLDIGMSKGLTSVYQSSEWADKVRSNDAYTDFVVGVQKIEQFYNDKLNKGQALTVSDYKEKKDWQSKFYQSTMDRAITEDDQSNLIFKTTFVDPATNILMKMNDADTKAQFIVHKRNVADQVNENIDRLGTNITQASVSHNIAMLKSVGIGGAREKVWGEVAVSANSTFTDKFRDGLNSPAIKPYLTNGVLTQGGMDKLFNDNYGQFAKRGNGEFNKADGDITDEAYEAMKRSFFGFESSVGAQMKAKVKTLSNIPAANSNIDIFSTPIGDARNSLKLATQQYVDVQAGLTPSKDLTIRESLKDMHQKVARMEVMDKIYADLKEGNVNFNEAMSMEHNIDESVVEVAEGVTIIRNKETIKRADVQQYVDQKLYEEFQANVINGDAESSAKFGKRMGELENTGLKSTATKAAIDHTIETFNNNGLTSAKSLNELQNSLHMAATYLKTTNKPSLAALNDSTLRHVSTHINNLTEQAKVNPKITEDYILASTKDKTFQLSRQYDTLRSGLATKKLFDVLSDSQTEELDADDIVSGGVWGETSLASGAVNVLALMMHQEDRKVQSGEEFKDYAKSKTMEVDDSWLPTFGTSVAIINPIGDNSTRGKNLVRHNMQSVVDKALTDLKLKKPEHSAINIDISDIVDNDNAKILQHINPKGEVMTTLNYFSNGSVIFSITMSPDELRREAD